MSFYIYIHMHKHTHIYTDLNSAIWYILLSVAEVEKTLLTQESGFALEVVQLSLHHGLESEVICRATAEYYWDNKKYNRQ